MNENPAGEPHKPREITLRQEDMGGVWANFAAVSHSPYEFTIDFIRLDFGRTPPNGIVVSRVNLSPLFVAQLMDALKQNWDMYAEKALPREVREGYENS